MGAGQAGLHVGGRAGASARGELGYTRAGVRAQHELAHTMVRQRQKTYAMDLYPWSICNMDRRAESHRGWAESFVKCSRGCVNHVLVVGRVSHHPDQNTYRLSVLELICNNNFRSSIFAQEQIRSAHLRQGKSAQLMHLGVVLCMVLRTYLGRNGGWARCARDLVEGLFCVRLEEGVLVTRVSTLPPCKVCTKIVNGCFASIVKLAKYRLGFCQGYL